MGLASRERLIGLELERCDMPTRLLLHPILNSPPVLSLLNALLSQGPEYGQNFQERLYHPRVREVLERMSKAAKEVGCGILQPKYYSVFSFVSWLSFSPLHFICHKRAKAKDSCSKGSSTFKAGLARVYFSM